MEMLARTTVASQVVEEAVAAAEEAMDKALEAVREQQSCRCRGGGGGEHGYYLRHLLVPARSGILWCDAERW
jgi:hypothetical protein